MYLSLYAGSLSNSFSNKFLILSHILLHFSNISLSLTKRFMHLLFLSKYLAYALICGDFMHNSDGRALP